MVNHSQFQTVKNVMGMQTAHFIDGAMVTPLMMKVNIECFDPESKLFFYKINLITEHQDKT